jgi:hypothetical protein
MRRLVALVLAYPLVAACPAPADAATWTPAAPIPAGANPSSPAAAIAADGSDVLAFVDAGGVEASVRPPGAPDFGPPQTLAPPPPAGGATRNLVLAQVPNGATIAAWTQDAPATTERVSWAERPPGGSFGPVHDVPRTGLPADAFTDELNADAGANGDVVLALTIEGTLPGGGHGLRVFAAVRPPGAEFGEPMAVGAAGSLSPDVAVGPDGDAVVAWLEGGSTRPGAIRAARRPPGGDFAAATTLDRTTAPGLAQPFVATGPGGETDALWYRRDGTTKRVYFAVRPVGASRFDGVGRMGTAPTRRYALAGGAGGDVAAVWDGTDHGSPVLRVRRRVAGHGFGPSVKLTHQPGVQTLDAAMTGTGTLVSAWQRAAASDQTELWTAGQASSGGRTELVRLQPPASFPGFALVAGAAQDALAAWTIPGSAPRWSARS